MYVGILCTEERLEVYQEICAKENRITYSHYPIGNYKGLTDFVTRTKAIYNFQALVVDISDCSLPLDDLERGIALHQDFCSTRLIFVAKEENASLSDLLFGLEVYNVLPSNCNHFATEISECIVGDGKNVTDTMASQSNNRIEKARNLTNPQIAIPSGITLRIGIAGVMPRCGATTVAMHIVSYCNHSGAKAIYISTSPQTMESILMFCQHEEMDGYSVVQGIPLSHMPCDGFEIQVCDLGCNVNALEQFDLQILCGTSKPWELPTAANFYLKHKEAAMVFCLSNGEDRENIQNIWEGDVHFAPFCESTFRCNDFSFFSKLLFPMIEKAVLKYL